MIGLLRADAIRLRHRYDVWIVGLAVPLLAAIGFIRGYFDVPSHYSYDTSQPAPPELLAQIAADLSHYGFPYSVVSMLDSVPWVLVAVFFLVATTIGGEYGWGTIRTSLLASTDRHGFLGARSIAMAWIALLMIGLLLALAVILPAFLAVAGNVLPSSANELPASASLVAGNIGVAIAARLLVVGFVVAFAGLLTVITRNPAFPLLFGLIYFILESYVSNSSFFRDENGPIWLARAFPLQSVEGLLGDTARAITTGDDPSAAAGWPIWLGFVAVAAWSAILYLAMDRIFNRSDITD